jgi:hypothetical protein
MKFTIEAPGKTQDYEIITGYTTSKRGVNILYKGEGINLLGVLLEDGTNNIYWGGALYPTAESRLLEANPGETIKYKNKKLTRLTEEQLKEFADKKFTLSMAPLESL